jgi:hypothetical protein
MMKIVDKGEETTNKANGIQYIERIPICEYMSCRRTYGKPPNKRPMIKCQLLGSRLPSNDESRARVHDRTTISCDFETN